MISRTIKSDNIEEILKEEIRQAIITLWNFDITTGRYVDEELQKEKLIKEIAGKYKRKFSEMEIKERMNKLIQNQNDNRSTP